MSCYRPDPKWKSRQAGPSLPEWGQIGAPSPQANLGALLPVSPTCSRKQEKPHFARTSSLKLFGATWGLKSAGTAKAIFLPGNVLCKTSISHCDLKKKKKKGRGKMRKVVKEEDASLCAGVHTLPLGSGRGEYPSNPPTAPASPEGTTWSSQATDVKDTGEEAGRGTLFHVHVSKNSWMTGRTGN